MSKGYLELKSLSTFEERLEYLRRQSVIGETTFGFDRIFNQKFYQTSSEWKRIRKHVIVRDNGCDLGVDGYDIPEGVLIYIHHIVPITMDDIKNSSDALLDPDNLVTTTFETHNYIHFGTSIFKPKIFVERKPNDTIPWR